MNTLLVTGANGFVGRHLVPIAIQQGFSVAGTGRGAPADDWPEQCPWFDVDLAQADGSACLPGEWWGVVHLAAVSVPAHYANDAATASSLNMLANLQNALFPTRLLCVSSCHVYGSGEAPKVEGERPAPSGAYGAAKLRAEINTLSTSRHDGRVARPFNHVGAGMHPDLFFPTLLRRIEQSRDGEPIIMDGRDSTRDFLHVDDICRAYLAILTIDSPRDRVFNVCRGAGTHIGELARLAVAALGRTNDVAFRNEARSRDDVDILVGDNSRIRAATGWAPQIGLAEAVAGIVGVPRG